MKLEPKTPESLLNTPSPNIEVPPSNIGGSIVKIGRSADGIRIDISTNDLVNLAKGNPEYPLKVVNESLFIDELIEQLKDYADSNPVECGCSSLEYLIGECVAEVGVMGGASVEEIEID